MKRTRATARSSIKPEIVYSRADWKAHKNRLGFDDLIDAKGRFIATVNVMDIAASELFTASYLDGGYPKQLFVLEADGCWSIYLAVRWLTPAIVQTALHDLGKLLGRNFTFEPYHLPAALLARYRREGKMMDLDVKGGVPADKLLHDARERTEHPPRVRRPSSRRMAALLTQKLKA